jgi:hypothetical protein
LCGHDRERVARRLNSERLRRVVCGPTQRLPRPMQCLPDVVLPLLKITTASRDHMSGEETRGAAAAGRDWSQTVPGVWCAQFVGPWLQVHLLSVALMLKREVLVLAL